MSLTQNGSAPAYSAVACGSPPRPTDMREWTARCVSSSRRAPVRLFGGVHAPRHLSVHLLANAPGSTAGVPVPWGTRPGLRRQRRPVHVGVSAADPALD